MGFLGFILVTGKICVPGDLVRETHAKFANAANDIRVTGLINFARLAAFAETPAKIFIDCESC